MPEFNPDKVTIRDLTVEEPEADSRSHFDPEKDIAGNIKKKIEHYLNNERGFLMVDELKSLASIINDMARDVQGDIRLLKGHVDHKDLEKAKAVLAKYKV